jgi:hypothetical protein
MSPAIFAFVIFQIGPHVYGQANLYRNPIYASHNWDERHSSPHSAFYWLRLLPETQFPGLNVNLPFTNNENRFWGKGNTIYNSSGEEKDRESQPLKTLSFHFWEKMSTF